MSDTVKIRYVGEYGAVAVPLPDGTTLVATKGEPVEVPGGDFAAGLLMQETNWQPSGAAAKEAAKEAIAAAEPVAEKGG